MAPLPGRLCVESFDKVQTISLVEPSQEVIAFIKLIKHQKYFSFVSIYVLYLYKIRKTQKYFPVSLFNNYNIKILPPQTKAEHLSTGGVTIISSQTKDQNLPLYHLRFGKLLIDQLTLRGVETVQGDPTNFALVRNPFFSPTPCTFILKGQPCVLDYWFKFPCR